MPSGFVVRVQVVPEKLERHAVGHLVAVRPATGTEPEPRPLGRPGAGRERRLEPGVLVRDVVGHDVHDGADADAEGVRDQPLGLLQRAEDRVDGPVVGHVVAAVGERRDDTRA